jgi:hypothetical protein
MLCEFCLSGHCEISPVRRNGNRKMRTAPRCPCQPEASGTVTYEGVRTFEFARDNLQVRIRPSAPITLQQAEQNPDWGERVIGVAAILEGLIVRQPSLVSVTFPGPDGENSTIGTVPDLLISGADLQPFPGAFLEITKSQNLSAKKHQWEAIALARLTWAYVQLDGYNVLAVALGGLKVAQLTRALLFAQGAKACPVF